MAGRKLIELLIDEDADAFGVEAISLVKFPAIESNFVYFSKQGKTEKTMYAMASVDDEEKRTLIGPALIPDKRIPRYDEFSGEEYDVYFSKSTCQQASELFLKTHRTSEHTFEHESPVDGVHVVESWIVSNPEMDKSRHFNMEVPEGTWMVRVHVENDEMWQFVKEKKVAGFSIEGYFLDKLEEMSERPKPTLGRKLKSLVTGRKLYAEIQTDNGATFATEADEFGAGVEAYKIGAEGTAVEIDNGTYKTKAGTEFEIYDGVVTEWDGQVQEVEEKAEEESTDNLKETLKTAYENKLKELNLARMNRTRRHEYGMMETTNLAELEYYDEGYTILTDWEAEEFVMDEFSYEMSNDIQIVFISGISRGIYVGERQYDQNQPMWDAYEYARQYPDSKV